MRIALNYKEIPFEYIPVNLLKGEQLSEEFTAINPSNSLPCLEIDGIVLCQSISILEYLEETRKQHSLLPEDPIIRATVRRLVGIISCDTQPIQNLAVLKKVSEFTDKCAWSNFWINRGLEAFEKVIQKTSGKYSVGNSVTLADVCLIPQIYNAKRFNVDLSAFPNICRVQLSLESLPAFRLSIPEKQPDFPNE